MTRHVYFCGPDDALDHAAQLMWEHDCGAVPVCTGDGDGACHAIGMITDRDICMCALFQHKPLSELRIREAMATQLLSCQPGDSLEHAEKVMRGGRVRRLPVADERGTLVGVVSLADLAREAASESPKARKDISEEEVGDTLAAICAPSVPRSLRS